MVKDLLYAKKSKQPTLPLRRPYYYTIQATMNRGADQTVDGQADLVLCCSHMAQQDRFSHDARRDSSRT